MEITSWGLGFRVDRGCTALHAVEGRADDAKRGVENQSVSVHSDK